MWFCFLFSFLLDLHATWPTLAWAHVSRVSIQWLEVLIAFTWFIFVKLYADVISMIFYFVKVKKNECKKKKWEKKIHSVTTLEIGQNLLSDFRFRNVNCIDNSSNDDFRWISIDLQSSLGTVLGALIKKSNDEMEKCKIDFYFFAIRFHIAQVLLLSFLPTNQ